jgi:hypothetical protein
MLNVSVAGVDGVMDPVEGVTCSHAGTFCCGDAATVKFALVAPESVIVCDAGSAPPCAWVNPMVPEGVTVTEAADVTVIEIGIVSVSVMPLKSPVEVIVIELL